jgi:hypothetical protein
MGGNEVSNTYKVNYQCRDCGHVQQVTEVHTENGVYAGSGANFCDKCDGVPERVQPLIDRGTDPSNAKQAEAARATARIAIAHLQSVLNKSRTAQEQWAADRAAREWLESIGSEPG